MVRFQPLDKYQRLKFAFPPFMMMVLKSILSAPYRAPDYGRLELNAYEIRNISHSFIIYLYQFESWPDPIVDFSNKKRLSTFLM